MRFTPFGVVYENGNAVFSNVNYVLAGHVTDINAAIATVNLAHPTFGISNVPTVPTGSLAIFYSQPSSPGLGGQAGIGGQSELVRAADVTSGWNMPSKSMESILTYLSYVAAALGSSHYAYETGS